jgi:hypothetical protein
MITRRVLVGAALVVCATVAGAQPPRGGGGGRRGGGNPQQRAQMEQQIRATTLQVFRQSAHLTDSQVVKLQQVINTMAPQTTALANKERRVRMALRGQQMLVDSANQDSIAVLLDQLMIVSQERLLLVQQERALIKPFLTPLQQSLYQGMQEQVMRRVDELAQQGNPMRAVGAPGPRGRGRGGDSTRPPPIGPPPPAGTKPPPAT